MGHKRNIRLRATDPDIFSHPMDGETVPSSDYEQTIAEVSVSEPDAITAYRMVEDAIMEYHEEYNDLPNDIIVGEYEYILLKALATDEGRAISDMFSGINIVVFGGSRIEIPEPKDHILWKHASRPYINYTRRLE